MIIGSDLVIRTGSPLQTLEFGRFLGTRLHSGAIVGLMGVLGAGKTWLAKGIASGLGVPEREYVTSPAYDLIHEYQGRLPVFHMDFYRLDELSPSDRMWIDEYLFDAGVCIIEWADKFLASLATSYLTIELRLGESPTERVAIVREVGSGYSSLLKELPSWAKSWD